MLEVEKNLLKLHTLINQYENKYKRKRGSVTLLAVSKSHSASLIKSAYEAGQRLFAENYLQEALLKMQTLRDLQDIKWHFIGQIQANKTRKIAEHFDWVQSVSSLKIAQRLHSQRPDHLSPLNICIEVNISKEARKSGIDETQLENLIEACSKLNRLRLRGLMVIPKLQQDSESQRKIFHHAYLLYKKRQKKFDFDTLSMGMSSDFEAAIAEGATIVRIGTALFGKRTI